MFVGRIDDMNAEGMQVIRELTQIVELHSLEPEVLVASIRHPRHVTEAALAGAHIATGPINVLRQMVHHPLTDTGIRQFRKDWQSVQTASGTPETAGVGDQPRRLAPDRDAHRHRGHPALRPRGHGALE